VLSISFSNPSKKSKQNTSKGQSNSKKTSENARATSGPPKEHRHQLAGQQPKPKETKMMIPKKKTK
jgi:hypothetical protein